MIKIAHRGNYKGTNSKFENTVEYIEDAIAAGYNVEVDAWLLGTDWFLGHDFPKENVDRFFFERPEIWTHAKNLVGYVSLYNNPKAHTFWHNKDDFVFTSKGIKWTRSGVITHDGIMVMPEYGSEILEDINLKIIEPLGVCLDDFRMLKI